jgi:hypothetical protein
LGCGAGAADVKRQGSLERPRDSARAALDVPAISIVEPGYQHSNMQSDVPSEIASAIQFGSINRHPSPRHDLNPSTAASTKEPVYLDHHSDVDSDIADDEIPLSILNPVPRKQTMPPLPDLRFEQSYLKSIEQAKSWKGVAWITLRDQVGIVHGQ